jgi:hypothetical protein
MHARLLPRVSGSCMCCCLVIPIEELLRPLKMFYLHFWPIHWLSVVSLDGFQWRSFKYPHSGWCELQSPAFIQTWTTWVSTIYKERCCFITVIDWTSRFSILRRWRSDATRTVDRKRLGSLVIYHSVWDIHKPTTSWYNLQPTASLLGLGCVSFSEPSLYASLCNHPGLYEGMWHCIRCRGAESIIIN